MLTSLRESGIIRMDRRRLTTVDEARLTAVAEGRESPSEPLGAT